MTSSKNTKRTLLASILSLILCAEMLVGSTFAWFTDSVTSGRNKIVAGNLDVELYAKVGDTYTKVTEDTNLFREDTLWEPGHLEVINLKIENLGTLALKYKLGINIVSEKFGTNVNGKTFALSRFMNFALINDEKTFASHAEAVNAMTTAAVYTRLSGIAGDDSAKSSGILYPSAKATPEKPSSRFVTLIVYMPTSVGNDANYKSGTEAPEIDLGINLFAEQTPYEEDSFDNKYDEQGDSGIASINGKVYQTLKLAVAAAKSGDTIRLLCDTKSGALSTNKKLIIDLDGHKITSVSYPDVPYFLDFNYDVTLKNGMIECPYSGIRVRAGAKLTMDHVILTADKEGKDINSQAIYLASGSYASVVTLRNSEINSGVYGLASWNPNCKVTIDNCKIKSNAFGVYQNGKHAPATFTIKNSQITDTAGTGIYISNTADKPFQDLTIENCTVTGPTAVEVKHTNATIANSTLIASNTSLSATTSTSGACTVGYALAVTSNNDPKRNIVDPATGTVTVTDCKLYSGSADGEPNGHVFVYKTAEGASVTVNGNAVPTSEKYDDE